MLFTPIYSFVTIALKPFWGAGLLDSIPQTTLESILVLCTIFAILLAIGIYLILYIRKSTKNDGKITNDELLLRFSKLYDEGKLTKEEYRQIKLQFAQKLKEEQIVASRQQTLDDSQGTKKPRKKKKKRHSDTQDSSVRFRNELESLLSLSPDTSNNTLLKSILEKENSDGFRSGSQSNSSAHILSDAPVPSKPDNAPPHQDAPGDQ